MPTPGPLFARLVCLCFPFILCACNLSPRYVRPDMQQPLPQEYKEVSGWKSATPMAHLERGPWWEMFADASLNELMQRLNTANQSIAEAAANLRQARAQMDLARSAFFPGLTLPGSLARGGQEGAGPNTRYSFGLSSQWEISFWNALPAYEAAKAQAEATAADYATMRLAMQAELAQAYFQLRALDGQHSLYESTIDAYAKAVELTRSQLRGGIVTPADVAQAEAQLASAQAQLASVQRQRSLLEHSIAILIGQIPAHFALPREEPLARIPAIPTGIPSELLERRPDVSSAERLTAAANQQIGLARAAWFPSLSIGGDFLFQGTSWVSGPLYSWSLGPDTVLSLFEGGKKIAENEIARAGYDAQVSRYRQTALQAFKDVEDNIAALRYLSQEAEAQDRAVAASREALRLSLSQYRGGLITYLQVVANQTTVLTNERSAIDLQGQRLTASVNLIKALGGGWRDEDLPALLATPAAAEPAPQAQPQEPGAPQ